MSFNAVNVIDGERTRAVPHQEEPTTSDAADTAHKAT